MDGWEFALKVGQGIRNSVVGLVNAVASSALAGSTAIVAAQQAGVQMDRDQMIAVGGVAALTALVQHVRQPPRIQSEAPPKG